VGEEGAGRVEGGRGVDAGKAGRVRGPGARFSGEGAAPAAGRSAGGGPAGDRGGGKVRDRLGKEFPKEEDFPGDRAVQRGGAVPGGEDRRGERAPRGFSGELR